MRFFLLLQLLLITTFSYAVTIKGKVTDEKGNPLAFATVMETGTMNGTAANADGIYTLDVAAGNTSITCQYLGFETVTIKVRAEGSSVTINFKLPEQRLDIGEVVVTNGEDPAYEKMRQVIAKRKYHAGLISTFETDVYMKGSLRTRSFPKSILGFKITDSMKAEMGMDSSGKGIIYLLEELSEYSYQSPGKEYNKVISVRESGDPQGVGFATMPPITNIYENNLKIMDGLNERGFISPANSNAFLYYRYKFLGSYFDGDRMISKIQVTPKRKYEPLFTGVVYVVENEWVFQSVSLTLTAQSQMNTLDTLRLEQVYTPIKRDLWVIQNQVLYPTIRIMGMDIAGNFVTTYSRQKVNEPVDAAKFEGKIIASYDSLANDRKAAYWDTIRPVPLAEDEVRDFHKKDSLYTAIRSRSDSLKKAPSANLGPGSFLFSGPSVRIGKNTLSMDPIISSVNYNTVEGVNATLTLRWLHRITDNSSWNIAFKNRYGFSNKHYNPLLSLGYYTQSPAWKGRNWSFQVQGGRFVYQLNNDNPITPFINLLYTLFDSKNYMKLYENRFGKLSAKRSWGNGLRAAAAISFEERISLENTADYTFREKHDPAITPNNPSSLPAFENHRAAVITASLSYQPGWKYVQYPKYKTPVSSDAPVFTLRYTKGIPGIFDSKSDFDKWSAEIGHKLRLRLLGSVDYRIVAGGFLNKNYTGIPDMKHLFGNQTFLANPYLNSFQLAPYYRFSNTADFYIQGHLDWHLGGLLTNKIPLFRRLNWYLVGGTNTLYINKDNYYAEAYVGLENIGWKYIRFARVDFIAGYESGKDKPSLGVRVGLGEVLWSILGINNGRDD